jgi:hypothetical protein
VVSAAFSAQVNWVHAHQTSPEDEHALARAAPVNLAVEQAHHLGDGENEHQVEEELDEGGALVFGEGDGLAAHGRSVTMQKTPRQSLHDPRSIRIR